MVVFQRGKRLFFSGQAVINLQHFLFSCFQFLPHLMAPMLRGCRKTPETSFPCSAWECIPQTSGCPAPTQSMGTKGFATLSDRGNEELGSFKSSFACPGIFQADGQVKHRMVRLVIKTIGHKVSFPLKLEALLGFCIHQRRLNPCLLHSQ